MNATELTEIVRRPVNHIGWLVDDIEMAARQFATIYGVGPFMLVADIKLEVSSHGKPCTFDHSAAFTMWEGIALEIQQIDDARPFAVAAGWGVGKGCHMNHVSYTAPDPDTESERLEALGMPRFLSWKGGPLQGNCHGNPLGPAIEIHKEGAQGDHWERIVKACRDWDGTDLVRPYQP